MRHGTDIRNIREWIEEGGEREDDRFRYLHHFHDPLKPWDTAGLDRGFGLFSSSVRWMQDADQSSLFGLPHEIGVLVTGGSWSWRDARRLYYEALTEADPLRREALWADLFRAVGQLMHLVVDASVPEHTRNDIHPLGALRLENSYERWVGSQHAGEPDREAQFVATYLSAPIGFVQDILALTPPAGEGLATAPVARLIDADRYDGSNPTMTVGTDPRAPASVGLSEIANANFFSEDTLRGQYPSPSDTGLIPVNLATPFGRVRRYFSRPTGQGLLPANPLRAECASEAFSLLGQLVQPPPYPCTDSLVWRQVAAHMLPRAVGYARGALDYFFRGSVTVTSVEWTPRGVIVNLRNTSTEEMEGIFEIYARHQPGTPSERRVRFTTLGEGDSIFLGAGEEWSEAITIPLDAVATSSYMLVFRGRLGLEQNAVVGQIFTVPYIEVRQTTYNADVSPICNRLPPRSTLPPYQAGITTSILLEAMRCEWRIVAHRVSGVLETNMPVDPMTGHPEPIIERIEASWIGGDVQGPAPLVLDGRPAGSLWERQGMEPDPTAFDVVDPIDRGRSYLYLLVTYRNGRQIEAHLATFTYGVSAHVKSIWLDNAKPTTPRYLVTSGRGVTEVLAYNWLINGHMARPLFEALTIGGMSVPADTQMSRPFGSVAISEGLLVDAASYSDAAIDDFEIFTVRKAADTLYAGIDLLGPHPQGPFFSWTAELRRVYQPIEREFLRAFVATDPEPFLVELTAQEVGAGDQ